VSRRISLLRAHGLVAKIPRSRRYRVTKRGQRFMSTAIQVRTKRFSRGLNG
jgi:predicted transcriptional regulator